MTTRYTLKLGVGLMSLMAATGTAGAAHAGASGEGGPAGEAAYGLALASQAATPAASAAVPAAAVAAAAPASNGRQSQTFGQKVGPDGLVEGGAYVEADHIQTDDIRDADGRKVDNKGILHAYGNVLMRYKGNIIRADEVTYNSQTGVTTATGHAQTINDDGSVTFSDQLSYDDNGQQGVGENVASIGTDQSKILARRVDQLDANTKRLTDVIYTPCQLCVVKGETAPPTWSIEATQITQRKNKKMVYYNNALVRIHGVPVFYTPYMWTPDPELDRASGFLSPKVQFSKKRGFSYEQPYLWSISPYSDLIISPQFNADVNPLINMEYDRHFYSGMLHARMGYTDESFFNNRGDRVGPSDSRYYILADGSFKINDNWRWSFTAQHVEDDFPAGHYQQSATNPAGNDFPHGGTYANFFERYNIDNAFDPVGELTVDSRELINQFNITRQVDNAYFSVSMASFQSLQIAGYLDAAATPRTFYQPYATDSDLFPVIAPQIEAYWTPKARILGGQASLSLNAIGIKHKYYDPLSAPGLADGTSGFDTARASVGAAWYGDMTTKSGVKWGPFVDTRYDYYHETDLTSSGLSANASRGLATAGFNVSYPLYRRFKSMTAVVEPIAQFAVSPRTQADPAIPNEDSQSFEFDDTTLFTVNKSPGFDIYESGSRLNLGLRTRLQWQAGLKVEGLIGRTFRDKDETDFMQPVTIPASKSGTGSAVVFAYDPYGIGKKASDWVVDGDFDTGHGLYGYTRLRLDADTLRLAQGEMGLSVKSGSRLMGTMRYIVNNVLTPSQIQTQINALPSPVISGDLRRFGDNYRDLQLYTRYFFTKNWGVSARVDRDMVSDTWRRSQFSVIYRDDCAWFELVYQRNDTVLTNINGKPQGAILFRLNFTTLGSSGSDFNDVR